ncbi:hypothetical protein [Rhodopila sp.]|uniref:hypothetical protein n=1 Tax=Rhodopila sp. TaxID=2480087 RepID=UPI003D120035
MLAIGGQGGGVLVDWIVPLAEREGWRAQSTSVLGVAPRTGAKSKDIATPIAVVWISMPRLMAAAERPRGRPDAAGWVRRLRKAAVEDEPGLALRQALRTVDSFLDGRQAA